MAPRATEAELAKLREELAKARVQRKPMRVIMSVSMGLRHKTTGEYREVPIASLRGFTEGWLPVCERLGLQFVPWFSGGALTTVPEELIPEIISELRLLLAEVENDPETAWIAERVQNIIAAFAEMTPAEWEYGFG